MWVIGCCGLNPVSCRGHSSKLAQWLLPMACCLIGRDHPSPMPIAVQAGREGRHQPSFRCEGKPPFLRGSRECLSEQPRLRKLCKAGSHGQRCLWAWMSLASCPCQAARGLMLFTWERTARQRESKGWGEQIPKCSACSGDLVTVT